jgi:uncharacterized lipoprotein YmbA
MNTPPLTTILFFSLLLAGCNVLQPIKDAAVYHLLEPLVPDRALTASTPALAIKRPTLPGYLDRQQLVTRKDGQLMMSNLDVWAEPLDVGISRVMASNLSRLTGSMNIQPGASFTSMDYTQLLELLITQFEPDEQNQLIFKGTWKLQPTNGKDSPTQFFKIIVPQVSAATMKDRVTAMNAALEQLAREVAGKL